MSRLIVAFVIGVSACALAVGSEDPIKVKEITDQLKKAKDSFDADQKKARDDLLAQIVAKRDAAQKAGDLPGYKKAEADRKALAEKSIVPRDPDYVQAVKDYDAAVQKARDQWKSAQSDAVKEYTKAGNIPKAEATDTDLKKFEADLKKAEANPKKLDVIGDVSPGPTVITKAGEYDLTGGNRFVHFGPGAPRVILNFNDAKQKLYFARVYDLGTGQPITPPIKHQEHVWTTVFSPDGKMVITASGDGTAIIWDVANGKQATETLKHGGMQCAAFSPDSKQVVTVGGVHARVWNVATGHTDEAR